ncbi:MAG: HAD family hydrolase [Lachnospiraceae bacterium]|nr:HAD family hydrolase [Lachnospiraceae bacterium]
MKYEYILWDLDGTLTESGEGIINSVLYALEKMGIHETDREKLAAFVGPPLLESFSVFYGMAPEKAKEAMGYYREYFVERGMFENKIYPGITEALARLGQAGYKLAVATSKPEVFAKKILEHFGLTQYFVMIGGSSLDEKRSGKAEVIRYVMEALNLDSPDGLHGRILMVGDRKHDVEGAAENGIPCAGVLYGYGSREELERAGAVMICDTAEELAKMLLADEKI